MRRFKPRSEVCKKWEGGAEKGSPLERNGEAIPESITRRSQSNFLLGFRFPAALGADRGGTEGILLDSHQAWCGDKACEGGDSLHFETEELLGASLDRNFREGFERWIVEYDEAMLALKNSCT